MFAIKAARPVSFTFLSIVSVVSVAAVVGCGTTNGSPVSGAGGAGGAGGDTLCGNVTLSTTKTVAAGETLTICSGSSITASDGVSLTVDGTLQIQGTAASPVKLVGATSAAGAWTGLVLDADGAGHGDLPRDPRRRHRDRGAPWLDVQLRSPGDRHLEHAADPVVERDDRARHAARAWAIAKSGSPVLINNASPQITNTSVTQGLFGGVDMIVVGGSGSAPLFDHVEVADSHCAFHFNESTGATITNSFIHHNAYGFMVIGSDAGHFNHNNWEDNQINIGTCEGGISDEVAGNYFAGTPFGDGTCDSLTATGTATAPYATSVVGPQP